MRALFIVCSLLSTQLFAGDVVDKIVTQIAPRVAEIRTAQSLVCKDSRLTVKDKEKCDADFDTQAGNYFAEMTLKLRTEIAKEADAIIGSR